MEVAIGIVVVVVGVIAFVMVFGGMWQRQIDNTLGSGRAVDRQFKRPPNENDLL